MMNGLKFCNINMRFIHQHERGNSIRKNCVYDTNFLFPSSLGVKESFANYKINTHYYSLFTTSKKLYFLGSSERRWFHFFFSLSLASSRSPGLFLSLTHTPAQIPFEDHKIHIFFTTSCRFAIQRLQSS